jgi:hypothetical protein
MEILRGICETEPKPPSVALISRFKVQSSNSGAEASKNNNQQTSNIEQPTNLESEIQNLKSLKGDLDNIVLKPYAKRKSSVTIQSNNLPKTLNITLRVCQSKRIRNLLVTALQSLSNAIGGRSVSARLRFY